MPSSTGTLTIHVDGASKGNPGSAGIGVVIYDADGATVCEVGEHIGVATNNVAEYTALIRALQEAETLGGRELVINSDSELMVRQLSGQYRVKNEHLRPLFDRAVSLLRRFERVHVRHVLREKNKRADELASSAARQKKTGAGTGRSPEHASGSKITFET